MEPRQKQFSLWYVLAAVLLMLGGGSAPGP